MIETEMKSDAIFKEKTNENRKLIKLAIPNVKEGSVVEISYKIISPFWVNFQDWEFQSTIPIRLSEYTAKIPEYFTYQKFMQGYVVLDVNETSNVSRSIEIVSKERSEGRITQTTYSTDKIDYQEANSRWGAKNVPAFKEEPFMNSPKNYTSKIVFELSQVHLPGSTIQNYLGSWEAINDEFLKNENFGEVINRSNFLNKNVEELTAGASNDEQKIIRIYNFVKQNVEWDGTYRKFTDGNFKKVLEEKKGSTAEINLLLTTMLKKAGITADPVLISTRNNGLVRDFIPVSSQFNSVICVVKTGDKALLLDATDRSLPIDILPERCLNGSGFIISKENSGWVSLNSTFKSKSTTNFNLTMTEEGVLKGSVVLNKTGYDAQRVRQQYFGKGEADYLKQLAEASHWQVDKNQFDNIDKLTETLTESYELTIDNYAQSTGGVIYLNPILKDRMEINPFKTEHREYPVDFKSPFEKIMIAKIIMPEGYVIDELPKPKMILLPNKLGKYVYSVSQLANAISITSQLSINKSLFSQDEYSALRDFYGQIVAKQAEQIVLKKK